MDRQIHWSYSHQEWRHREDVGEKIGRAFRAFGSLHKAVFRDEDLSMTTKHLVYVSVVLGTLLYGFG